MDDDRRLVRAVRDGERGAFAELVQRHQRLVWHLVQRLVRDTEDTRELCQETFVRVHATLHQWRGEARLASWIGRVAWTVALRFLEKKRIELVVEPAGDAAADGPAAPSLLEQAADPLDLEARVADAQMARHLHAAIDALAPLPRLLLTLYHLHEMPIGEIAQITGLPPGTIKSHLFRSRLALRARLAPLTGRPADPPPPGTPGPPEPAHDA